MSLRAQLFVIVVAVVLALVVFDLVRRKKLHEHYSVFWLLLCAAVLVVAVWNELIFSVARQLRIASAVSLAVVCLFVLVVGYLLHLSIAVTRLKEQNRELTQWVGILRSRLGTEVDDTDGADDPADQDDG